MIRVNSLSEGLSRLRQKFGNKSTKIRSGETLSRGQVRTLLRESESLFYVYNPRLIGPFAEFEFTVEASSLMPPRKREESGRGDRP